MQAQCTDVLVGGSVDSAYSSRILVRYSLGNYVEQFWNFHHDVMDCQLVRSERGVVAFRLVW